MTALYHLEHRFVITSGMLVELRERVNPSGSFSWVGDGRLRIHTFRGVPGKHVDVLLSDTPYRSMPHPYGDGLPEQVIFPAFENRPEISRPWLLVCDIGLKQGRFDGAKRWRITVRDLRPTTNPASDPPKGMLAFEETDHLLAVEAIWKGGFWGQEFPRLRYTIDDRTDIRGILIHQAKTYYLFLWGIAEAEVRALADSWAVLPSVTSQKDINLLNRDASKALYDLARNLGYRKLTLRERIRLGLPAESQQWQRQDYVAALRVKAGLGSPLGVGQHTLAAASGQAIRLPREVCLQCEELREDCGCVS